MLRAQVSMSTATVMAMGTTAADAAGDFGGLELWTEAPTLEPTRSTHGGWLMARATVSQDLNYQRMAWGMEMTASTEHGPP